MQSRLQPPSKIIRSILRARPRPSQCHRQYASATAAIASSSQPLDTASRAPPLVPRHPRTQPPSWKPAEYRKTQLLRQYTSLLKSSPLLLIFQHNNILAGEWTGLRRELKKGLRKVDAKRNLAGLPDGDVGESVKIQVIQSGIFAAALRIVEYYTPNPSSEDPFTHSLSKAAHQAVVLKKTQHALAPLLSGPLAVAIFPSVSPEHLKAALSILAPSPPQFPAPTRRDNPEYHEPAVQAGLQKLMFLGARVEGQVFDAEGTHWVGGIEGGLEGLRGQLVAMLQSVGGGVTSTLESASRSLYFTMEGRRMMLEEEAKGIETSEESPKTE